MLSCKDIYDHASAFFDEDHVIVDPVAYKQHLELCAACDNFYRSFQTTVTRAQQALHREAPPGLADEMVRLVREKRSA